MTITIDTYPTLGEAASAMRTGSQFLGGGTMVVRGLNFASPDFDKVIRSTDSALSEIRPEGNGIKLGAGVTMARLMQASGAEFLEPVARAVGGPAVRNMATIGGNLFVCSPFGDFGVALLALDALVQMSDGQMLPIEDFYRQRENLRGLVSAVIIPRSAHGAFRFRKVVRTKPKGAAVVTIAAHLPGGNRISGARIALGAMGSTPLRAKDAERALEGGSLDAHTVQRVCEMCCNGLNPQDDSIASAWYRREVAPVHLRRLLLGEES
ncbi:FAD binding domain-containing protein [Shimia sp.]|uniref:FAD binding domain-containing protein n=1 Tax=Shimia sp. TaxID=1954381 RepID=UPI0032979FFA